MRLPLNIYYTTKQIDLIHNIEKYLYLDHLAVHIVYPSFIAHNTCMYICNITCSRAMKRDLPRIKSNGTEYFHVIYILIYNLTYGNELL